jgi:16S rRNA (cytosine1402-N4)-methyltransferase
MTVIEVNEHEPVLLEEVLEGLAIKPKGIYVDCTFGRGGHAKAILWRLSNSGRLFAMDKDPRAVEVARRYFKDDRRFHIWHSSFTELEHLTKQCGIFGKVDGVLLDLGVSSPQLEDPARGFSFLRDGPLDMRMNPERGISAAEWINRVSEKDLALILKEYGEERYANRIAKEIVKARRVRPIETTGQLVEIISWASPRREKHKHPATRSFQAIRIFINQELNELRVCLNQCLSVLAVGGRLAVISFHSLEDRIVKQFIKQYEYGGPLQSKLPIKAKDFHQRLRQLGKAIKPTLLELRSNPRARSAVLRIAEKLS